MDIRVSGHQLDTGAALRTHVETRLNAIKDKYFANALSAQATVGRAPRRRRRVRRRADATPRTALVRPRPARTR